MSQAYIQAIRSFLSEKMLMPQDTINNAGIHEACLSADKKLCVRFATREGALSLNNYKKNLPPGQSCEDFIPPALRAWEDTLIQHGNKVRAERVPGLPAPKTRRVWQNDTRVLQVKEHPARRYRTILGNNDVGRYVPETELRMLTRSFQQPSPLGDLPLQAISATKSAAPPALPPRSLLPMPPRSTEASQSARNSPLNTSEVPEDLLTRWEQEGTQLAGQDGVEPHVSVVIEASNPDPLPNFPMEQSKTKSVYKEIEESEGVNPNMRPAASSTPKKRFTLASAQKRKAPESELVDRPQYCLLNGGSP